MSLLSRRSACRLLAAGAAIAAAGPALSAQPVDDGTWSTHPTWLTLKKTRLTTDDRGMVHAAIAPEVMGLAGKTLLISGFILPIEAAASSKHFILSRYSPECPFCPAGAPNEVIEIFSNTAIAGTSTMVFLQGRFAVQNDVEKGLFYRMDHAGMA
jgi:hypothetical protein